MDNSLEIGVEATLYTNQATSPGIPAAGAAPLISGLREGSGLAPKYVQLEIDLGGTGTTVTLPGPVKLYVERGGKVRYAATLNDGAAITVGNAAIGGYQQFMQGLALGDRMAIVPSGALSGGGNFNAKLVAVKGAP